MKTPDRLAADGAKAGVRTDDLRVLREESFAVQPKNGDSYRPCVLPPEPIPAARALWHVIDWVQEGFPHLAREAIAQAVEQAKKEVLRPKGGDELVQHVKQRLCLKCVIF